MDNYIDYDYYKNTFKGNLIPEEEFDNLATRASNEVRTRILNKPITGFENAVKNATCSVADILYNQLEIESKIKNISSGIDKQVSSEKVGDYSRNFTNTSVKDLMDLLELSKTKINDEINLYLGMTGLLSMRMDYVR